MSEDIVNGKQITKQESLQPQRIHPKDKAYQSVLDIEERLRLGDATNIALTGPYGSGKSSILLSLKLDYPKHKYLSISLATLKDYTGENQKNLTKENIDRLIEYSILQQLIYRETQETLPYSRIKRIFHLSKNRICKIAFATLAAILALVIVFEPPFLCVDWLCRILGRKWLNISGDSICLLYLVWYSYKALEIIIPALSNSRLNKLNLKSGEIEIVKNTSIFNKHLDEILYFFENTEYDVVILEDLDRFQSKDIFLKLRELNLLLNESKVVDRKVFFIYAVRDDIFIDTDRVKCFDYITTVIPVINRSNAKNLLKAELEKRGVNDINDKALREIGFFLYDMRLLKNIANEYVQYREKLPQGINSARLLAMIVYKNYYPKDFADLHDCKGTLYQLINLKEEFIASKVEMLEKENAQKRERYNQHQKEMHLKEAELRRLYVDAYWDKLGNSTLEIKAGDSFYSPKDLASNESVFNQLISSSNVSYKYLDRNYYNNRPQQNTVNIAFSEIETSVDPSISYHDRLIALRQAFEALNDNETIRIKKEDLRSQSLSQIMSEIDYTSIPAFKALDVPKLVEYLVVNGYINENYYDYISFFYDNFIDAHDWNFILDLKLGKAHAFDYPINNIEACITEIPNNVFRKNSILNIAIVDYLASRQDNRLDFSKLLVILRTIVESRKYSFLIEYLLKGKYADIVFSTFFSQNKNLWDEFNNNDNDKHILKQIWFKYAEREQSCDGSRDWLSESYSFIASDSAYVTEELWCELIEKHDYSFDVLVPSSNRLLKAVCDKNAYVLNGHNVAVLLSSFLGADCNSVSYSLILDAGNKTLLNRINKNLGQCIQSVFSTPASENEGTKAIIKILENSSVNEKNKINYLKKQHEKISLNEIDDNDTKTLALKCEVIAPSWESVIHYMNNVSNRLTDNVLVNFIEKNVEHLEKSSLPQESQEDERMLLDQLIARDVLSIEIYERILNKFTKWYYSGGVPAIEERRIMLLIDNNMVRFTPENSKSLLSGYSGTTVVAYLLKNKREYLKNIHTIEYTTDVAYGLMKSPLSTKEKASIIPDFTKDILNEALANEIVIVLNQVEITLDWNFLLKVLSFSSRTTEKIRVVNHTLKKNVLDERSISAVLFTLPEPYNIITKKGKKPELPSNSDVRCLVEILDKQGYISSFSENKKGIRVNTKTK